MLSLVSHAKDELDVDFKRGGRADSTTKHVSKITWMRVKAKIVPYVRPVCRCVCFSQNKMLQPQRVRACIFPLQSSLLSELEEQNRLINKNPYVAHHNK